MATIRNDVDQHTSAFPDTPAPPPPVQRQRPRWQRLAIDALYPTVAFILAIIGWALWIELGSVKDYIVPGPVAVWTEMVDNFSFLMEQTQTTFLPLASTARINGGSKVSTLSAAYLSIILGKL